jgi:hypothetical protein
MESVIDTSSPSKVAKLIEQSVNDGPTLLRLRRAITNSGDLTSGQKNLLLSRVQRFLDDIDIEEVS